MTGAGTTIPTDIDIYQVTFEQFNDARYVDLDTLDMTYFTRSNPQGSMSAYAYTIVVTGDKVNLSKVGEYIAQAADHNPDVMYRIRRGNMGLQLDGRKDGVYLTIDMSGTDNFSDVGIKVWGNVLY